MLILGQFVIEKVSQAFQKHQIGIILKHARIRAYAFFWPNMFLLLFPNFGRLIVRSVVLLVVY